MAQDKSTGNKESGKEDAGKPQDPKLQADLTDEELNAVVGGARIGIPINATGILLGK